MRHLLDKTEAFGRVGDFWYELTTQDTRALARHLTHMPFLSGSEFSVDTGGKGLLGGGWSYVSNVDLKWRPRGVAVIGPDLQERIVMTYSTDEYPATFYVIRRPLEASPPGDGNTIVDYPSGGGIYNIKTDLCEYVLLPVAGEDPASIPAEELQVRWLVPIPEGIRPAVIGVGDRYLVSGIDFVLQRNTLVFREDPFPLFDPLGSIHVLGGWKKAESLMDYTLQVDTPEQGHLHIAEFYRNTQTAASLQSALAEVAGRIVMQEGKEVSKVQEWCDAVVYTFSDGTTVEVEYSHHLLSVGDYLPAGSILGGGIRVEGGRQGQPHWYREFSFPKGIPSEAVSPFPDLTIPDAPMRLEAYDTTDGNLHVRPYLTGSSSALARYWDWIRQAEISSGKYLNDVVGLLNEGDTTTKNGVDFFFENGLGEHAVVVELDRRILGSRMVGELRGFAEREKLHNSVLVFLDTASTAPS